MDKYKVAVTGGIGSGKSEALKIISSMGYPCFSADEISRELTQTKKVTEGIIDIFGEEVAENGILNRRRLSEEVFGDKNKLKKLEDYLHPLIIEEMINRGEGADGKIVVAEVPILFERGYESLFDKVLVIKRDVNERIRNVVKRDNLTVKEVTDRIKNQIDYEKIDSKLYTIIENDSDLKELYKKLRTVFDKIEKCILKKSN